MKLYFLRHAHALDGIDDAARPLSDQGRDDARKLAKFLKQTGIEFDAAHTSPLVRARETAEIILLASAGHKKSPKLEVVDAMTNHTSSAAFQTWLERLPTARHVLLVGHEPTISERVRRLLGMIRPDAFEMPKGGLACLETEDRRHAVLKLFVSPKRI